MSEGVDKKSVTETMINNLQMRNWNLQEKVGQLEKEKAELLSVMQELKGQIVRSYGTLDIGDVASPFTDVYLLCLETLSKLEGGGNG